ncbi:MULTISPECIES: hypothetical protein [Xanthomonas translucens group]|uniref:hypothetical protein n=1 Tax=Xanthomonas translucens group TaxID=3390202 RepID=UPI0009C0EF41|nr:hypothetical protein K8O61_00260 [Xanthomonas translucens pv. pistacia]
MFGLSVAWALLRPTARGAYELLLACAVLTALVPLAALCGAGGWVAPWSSTLLLAVDGCALTLGLGVLADGARDPSVWPQRRSQQRLGIAGEDLSAVPRPPRGPLRPPAARAVACQPRRAHTASCRWHALRIARLRGGQKWTIARQ